MRLRQRLGKRITELRKRYDMTQAAFGAAIGCTGKAISEIERGNSFPSEEHLEQMAKVFKIAVMDLFDFRDNRFMPPEPPLDAKKPRPYRRARRN
jgi:transcriptional regulator with XRE-family HTH domain